MRLNDSRKSRRHDFHGAAFVQRLPAEESPWPAQIRDISEGGCLMELPPATTADLSVDDVVELYFEVDEASFRTRAQIRVIRPRNLVGFRFVDMSDRRLTQLREFIRQLVRQQVGCPS